MGTCMTVGYEYMCDRRAQSRGTVQPSGSSFNILATNHILELIDLDYLMGALCKPRKKGGQTQKPRPALQREADSSECSTPPESDDEVPRID